MTTSTSPTDDVSMTSSYTSEALPTNSTSSSPPATSPSVLLVIECLYIVIGSLGMLGNLFVLVVIFSVRSMRKKLTNIYIINQSFIDLCVSVILVASANVRFDIADPGLAGQLYCKLWATKLFLWGFLVSSTYGLVALTVERYLEVVHPIWHKINFTRTKAYISVALAWLIGPVFNAAYMIPSSVVVNGQCLLYASWSGDMGRKAFGVFTVILQYIAPLGVLIYSYGRIVHRLTHKVTTPVGGNNKLKTTGDGQGKTTGTAQPPKEDRYQRARRNTIKTLVIVALSFVLCWSWNQIYYLMMNLGYPPDFTSHFYHFTVVMVFLNCCLNPLIYSLKYEPFQIAAKSLFCRRCQRKKVGPSGGSTATSSYAGE